MCASRRSTASVWYEGRFIVSILRALIACAALLLSGCTLLATKEALVGCQTADTVTTLEGISQGAREANPIVAWILEKSGAPGFVAVKAGVTLLVLHHYGAISGDLMAVVNGLTCAAAAHNLRVAEKLSRSRAPP